MPLETSMRWEFSDWETYEEFAFDADPTPVTKTMSWASSSVLKGKLRGIVFTALLQALRERDAVTDLTNFALPDAGIIPSILGDITYPTNSGATIIADWVEAFDTFFFNLVGSYINHTDEGGDWDGKIDIDYTWRPPVWTPETLLVELGDSEWVDTDLPLASWAHQRYRAINLLRWGYDTSSIHFRKQNEELFGELYLPWATGEGIGEFRDDKPPTLTDPLVYPFAGPGSAAAEFEYADVLHEIEDVGGTSSWWLASFSCGTALGEPANNSIATLTTSVDYTGNTNIYVGASIKINNNPAWVPPPGQLMPFPDIRGHIIEVTPTKITFVRRSGNGTYLDPNYLSGTFQTLVYTYPWEEMLDWRNDDLVTYPDPDLTLGGETASSTMENLAAKQVRRWNDNAPIKSWHHSTPTTWLKDQAAELSETIQYTSGFTFKVCVGFVPETLTPGSQATLPERYDEGVLRITSSDTTLTVPAVLPTDLVPYIGISNFSEPSLPFQPPLLATTYAYTGYRNWGLRNILVYYKFNVPDGFKFQ